MLIFPVEHFSLANVVVYGRCWIMEHVSGTHLQFEQYFEADRHSTPRLDLLANSPMEWCYSVLSLHHFLLQFFDQRRTEVHKTRVHAQKNH